MYIIVSITILIKYPYLIVCVVVFYLYVLNHLENQLRIDLRCVKVAPFTRETYLHVFHKKLVSR